PAEHDNLLADRIVDHRAGGARPPRSLSMYSHPRGGRDLAECGNCGKSDGGGGPNRRPQGPNKAGKISHWDLLGTACECITLLGGDYSGNACLARDLSVAEGEAGLTIW